jgi:serine/threonine protein kinase/Tfp pilus assembly protein PilF
MIGKTISHYKILEKLGEGGMGVVYKAQDIKLDRIVALKFLPKHLLCDNEAKTRFEHEAKAASALDHPNIATIHEIDEVEGECFMSMAYIEGKSIKELLKEKSFSIEEILNIAIQIAEGLNVAHKKSIVHRDIKPDNLMLTNEGLVKIMDFGLAKLRGAPGLTQTGSTVGTLAYMSPEQAQGIEVDQRSDIFSFGVVLYELITGQLPFKGEHEAAIIYSILNEKPEPLARYKANIPEGLQRIVDKAMEKNREERFQHVDEMLADLRKLKKELESTKEQPSTKKSQPSIAVLPFTNLSADKEQEYFCDGMAEEIINALTHVEGLRVVARTSAFSFRGEGRDIRDIGKKLNVRTLLEGSVRKAGNRVRITAQLINVSDGYHLWSEKYDRNIGDICCPEDIFAIQDEISLAIVEKLKVKLLGEEKVALVKRYTDDLEAYNSYLKGRYFWYKRTKEGILKGLEYFHQAIEKDPTYAVAYTGIADCYNMLGFFDYLSPKEAFPKAKAAAEKALEIDGTLAEAHSSLAEVKTYYDHDWLGAEREFQRALELNPSYSTAHQWYAEYLALMGRHDESIIMGKCALELDPLSPIVATNLAGFYWLARKYDEAIERYQKILEMEPDFMAAHLWLGLTYAEKGLYNEALAEFQKGIELSGGHDSPFLGWLGRVYCWTGKKKQAEIVLESEIERSKKMYISPFGIAVIYLGLGQNEQAFEWLEKAYEEKDHWMAALKVYSMFDSVRSDPRFTSLLKKMGLEK